MRVAGAREICSELAQKIFQTRLKAPLLTSLLSSAALLLSLLRNGLKPLDSSMLNLDSVSPSPIETSAISVSYAELSSTKRKKGGWSNGIGENLPVEEESDLPEQKRSKVSTVSHFLH